MNCFAQVAKRAVAIEMDPTYCRKLEARAKTLSATHQGATYSVACRRYQDDTPDADIYTWWQQEPHLSNAKVLDVLARKQRAGKVRKGAEAIVLFDNLFPSDRASRTEVLRIARWHTNVTFDERPLCQRLLSMPGQSEGLSVSDCQRAHGSFTVAAVPLASVPLGERPVENCDPHKRFSARLRCQVRLGVHRRYS